MQLGSSGRSSQPAAAASASRCRARSAPLLSARASGSTAARLATRDRTCMGMKPSTVTRFVWLAGKAPQLGTRTSGCAAAVLADTSATSREDGIDGRSAHYSWAPSGGLDGGDQWVM